MLLFFPFFFPVSGFAFRARFFPFCFLFAFWSENPNLPLARGRRRDPMRRPFSLSSFVDAFLPKGFFTTHAGHEHQSSHIDQSTHTHRERPRGDREGEQRVMLFFFFSSLFSVL